MWSSAVYVNSVKCAVCVCVVAFVVGVVNGARSKYKTNNPQCTTKLERRTDQNVARMLGFGPNGRRFPQDAQTLTGYCQDTTQLINRIDNYIKTCYKKDIRDMANVLVYSLKSNVKQFCRKKSKKLPKLLQSAQCINRHLIENDECLMLYYNNTRQLIPAKLDDQTKIKHACCYYITSIRCVEGYIDSVDCIRNNRELLLDFVRGVFGNFVDFMCGEYNESTTRCDELAPLPKPKTPNNKHYISFLFVLLELLESMKNFGLPSTN